MGCGWGVGGGGGGWGGVGGGGQTMEPHHDAILTQAVSQPQWLACPVGPWTEPCQSWLPVSWETP